VEYSLWQGKENIERMEITGVGDPSGRGLGFSYARAPPKAPVSNAMVKKKAAANRGGSTVTGTDADLRRLSMEAAREVCCIVVVCFELYVYYNYVCESCSKKLCM